MLTGLTRVRNESLIIKDTLEHFFKVCDHIILYDDDSTDNTVEIAMQFGDKLTIIEGAPWSVDREMAETHHRAILLNFAKMMNADWCLYFDADERLVGLLPDLFGSAFRFQLFDGYITPECNQDYTNGTLENIPRMWGPECRWITMLFRAAHAEFRGLDQREPVIKGASMKCSTKVKHFGKCVSEAQYLETCDYYANHFPKYSEKWAKRKLDGHMRTDKSDFGHTLYTWDELMLLPFHPVL